MSDTQSVRLIDYRPESTHPDRCPVCGAPVSVGEATGNVHIGRGDLEWAAKHGIDSEGPATTIYVTWWCSAEPDHEWGPVLLA